MTKTTVGRKVRTAPAETAEGRCLCGRVRVEIGVPARWAWHDHSRNSRLAHGAAYATYVGCWRSRVRIVKGESALARFTEEETGRIRSFCRHCGTPVLYERPHAQQMVNIPRALFETRTGREPLYHIAIEQAQEWTWRGEPLRPLKGFPGVVWTGPKRRKKRPLLDEEF
ncbi:GFA family protein [Inquilinus limosus]|uniref:Aldehyde-activating protein n=1 Tax=Inquilinus limosus TaxID=171674 RepID=A0A211ZRN0_9PROT|nr:GFA family protein [Inquilinus limosus]OWJ67915.1 aldehyde-activating protein [Inquilinus limosus]